MNSNIVIGIVTLGLIVGGFFVLNSPSTEDQNLVSKQKDLSTVPDFSFQDYEGNVVTNESFPGKVLIINAWATWCPFCINELPDFVELQKEFADEIVVIAIDRAESLDKAKTYTDNKKITDSIVFLLDSEDSFYQSTGGFSMPETIFVDTEGNIRIHKRGPMSLNEMRGKVNSMLK